MTGVFVLSAVMPSYLVDYLELTGPQMGFVTSAIGFGGALGPNWIVSRNASDRSRAQDG
jgi:hypothetical protein